MTTEDLFLNLCFVRSTDQHLMTELYSPEVSWNPENVTSFETSPQGDPFVKKPIMILLYRIVGAIGNLNSYYFQLNLL